MSEKSLLFLKTLFPLWRLSRQLSWILLTVLFSTVLLFSLSELIVDVGMQRLNWISLVFEIVSWISTGHFGFSLNSLLHSQKLNEKFSLLTYHSVRNGYVCWCLCFLVLSPLFKGVFASPENSFDVTRLHDFLLQFILQAFLLQLTCVKRGPQSLVALIPFSQSLLHLLTEEWGVRLVVGVLKLLQSDFFEICGLHEILLVVVWS